MADGKSRRHNAFRSIAESLENVIDDALGRQYSKSITQSTIAHATYEALLQYMLYKLSANDLVETLTEADRRLELLLRSALLGETANHTSARSLRAYSEYQSTRTTLTSNSSGDGENRGRLVQ